MTEQELLSLPKVGPEEASDFLGGDPSAQYIRLWCQDGDCPFGAAVRMSPHRWNYTINRQRLIRYRRGDLPMSTPVDIAQLLDMLVGQIKEVKPCQEH